jgi:L-ascorbate metabolism protein UlaG (beta-lactamase superfamily)
MVAMSDLANAVSKRTQPSGAHDAEILPDQVFLKPDVKIEPLVGGWYAWSHLIAPVQQAMNLAFRQLPLLQSFVANPAIHAAAAANPALVGGSFVALTEADAPRVKALLDDLNQRYAFMLAFAENLRQLDRDVQSNAHGFCLDEFYRGLPANLAGLVEIVYDLNNHPKTKVIEELLFRCGLDNRGLQQIYLHRTPSRDRPFFLSTPRLEGPGSIVLNTPFADPKLDALCAMKLHSGSLAEATRQHVRDDHKIDCFKQLFTPEPPLRKSPQYSGSGVRVRYFGHACVLVQTPRCAVLIDPTVAWERDDGEATLTFSDLPDFIDYVVLSHAHQDHICPEVLVQLRQRIGEICVARHNPGNIADPSMKLVLRELGFSNVRVLDPLDSIKTADGEIVSLPFPGEHCDLDVATKQCVYVTARGRRLVFLVDSDAVDPALYQRLAERIGPERLDALFIGMECHGAPLNWLYGPLLTRPFKRQDNESRRLNGCTSERALGVVQAMPCARAYVYAMGQEHWMKYLMGLAYQPDSVQITESDRFVAQCREAGIEAARLQGCREWEF